MSEIRAAFKPHLAWRALALTLLLSAGSLGLSCRLAQAQAPGADEVAGAASGRASAAAEAEPAYQTIDLDWRDPGRQREVPVKLYWPAHVAAGAQVPLIVFSHGIGGSRQGYSYLGSYWASQGYASLHVQHVGSDRQLWFGNPFGLVGRLQAAAQASEAVNRVRDVSFALDQILQSKWGPRIDAQHIVAAGHSYGANTTMLLAGAQVLRDGHVMDLQDRRIMAAIIISAPPFYGEGEPATILRPITIPTLHITATEDVIKIPGYYSAFDDRLRIFEAMGGARKSLAVFEGGSHNIFTDRSGTGGIALNPKVKAATRELTLAFLGSVFEGRQDGLQQWSDRWHEIVARWVRPATIH
jgi:predicted dienelactone hydrolase